MILLKPRNSLYYIDAELCSTYEVLISSQTSSAEYLRQLCRLKMTSKRTKVLLRVVSIKLSVSRVPNSISRISNRCFLRLSIIDTNVRNFSLEDCRPTANSWKMNELEALCSTLNSRSKSFLRELCRRYDTIRTSLCSFIVCGPTLHHNR